MWLALGKPFCYGLLLSFIGSIVPGVLSLRVWGVSVQASRGRALWLSLGIVCMEMFYVVMLLQFNFLAHHVSVLYPFTYFFLAVWMCVYAYRGLYPVASPVQQRVKKSDKVVSANYLFQGFLLGAMNLLPIPFWIAVTLHVQEQGLLEFTSIQAMGGYVVGIGLGTWIYFLCIVCVGSYLPVLQKMASNSGRKVRFLSLLYIAFVLHFLYKGIWWLYQ